MCAPESKTYPQGRSPCHMPGVPSFPSNKVTGWPLDMLAAKNRKAEQESTGTNEILRA